MASKTKRERTPPVFKKWKSDYVFKTLAGSAFSFGITILFALYNGFLGIRLLSIWHGSICVFYLLLAVVRGMILLTEKKARTKSESEKAKSGQKAFTLSATMLLVLNLALICPIALMAKFEKPVNMSDIPAIAVATYTTYKITVASINICKRKSQNRNHIFITELRTINFIDALVSVLILQNTLIMVFNTESSDNMLALTAVSSAAIYIIIVFITIRFIATGVKQYKKADGVSNEPKKQNR